MNEFLYNVRIRFKVQHRRATFKLGITQQELEDSVVTPFHKGGTIIIDGRIIAIADIDRITIKRVARVPRKSTIFIRAMDRMFHPDEPNMFYLSGLDVTEEFISSSPGKKAVAVREVAREMGRSVDIREVFVVHGRNSAARNALFDFLRAIDLHPVEWSEATKATGKGSPYVGEILEAISHAQAVVVLFTADDEARLKLSLLVDDDPPGESQLTGQPRPNVFFEAGMAMAEKQDRTILVRLGSPHLFSDIDGRHVVKLDGSSTSRHELAQRLETAGCPVTKSGQDWLRVGDFDAAIAPLESKLSRAAGPKDKEVPVEGEELQLPEDAIELLTESASDHSGTIAKVKGFGSTKIQTNGKEFGEKGNARSAARWQHALDILLTQGLIEMRAGKCDVFYVTHIGFEIAKKLRSPDPTTP